MSSRSSSIPLLQIESLEGKGKLGTVFNECCFDRLWKSHYMAEGTGSETRCSLPATRCPHIELGAFGCYRRVRSGFASKIVWWTMVPWWARRLRAHYRSCSPVHAHCCYRSLDRDLKRWTPIYGFLKLSCLFSQRSYSHFISCWRRIDASRVRYSCLVPLFDVRVGFDNSYCEENRSGSRDHGMLRTQACIRMG